jgi:hypothetical protein
VAHREAEAVVDGIEGEEEEGNGVEVALHDENSGCMVLNLLVKSGISST